MKRISLLLIIAIVSNTLFAQFGTTSLHVKEVPPPSTGLYAIYVFKDLSSSTVTYTTDATNTVSFHTYGAGISDSRPVAFSDSISLGGKTTYTISNLGSDRGLYAKDNNITSKVLWIINYAEHRPILHSIEPEYEMDCDNLKLLVSKDDLLQYRGTNGNVYPLARKYDLVYNTWQWNEAESEFEKVENVDENITVGTEIIIAAPNRQTDFILRGDQYAEAFSQLEVVQSAVYEPIRVEGKIVAEQTQRDSDGEHKAGSELGGSAPVEIQFYGHGTDAVEYYTWFIYKMTDPTNYMARYTDQDIEYTFLNHGEYKVVLEVANAESTCVTTSEVSFHVSESSLDVPNFFSPGTSPGSNDEFRVAYKSLVKFKCTIFNRWGTKLYEWTDPAKGWDGKHGGKFVAPGVYFYAIEAEGSDGVRYKKGGDINILR